MVAVICWVRNGTHTKTTTTYFCYVQFFSTPDAHFLLGAHSTDSPLNTVWESNVYNGHMIESTWNILTNALRAVHHTRVKLASMLAVHWPFLVSCIRGSKGITIIATEHYCFTKVGGWRWPFCIDQYQGGFTTYSWLRVIKESSKWGKCVKE